MVKIGHARISENGTANGTAGDQTGREVTITDFSNDKWLAVYRAKDVNKREIIAQKCEDACNNPNVGYSQATSGGRLSLFNAVCNNGFNIKDLDKPVNCDCSSLVMTCCRAAGIYVTKNMYTAIEDDSLMKTNEFIKYSDTYLLKTGNGLMRGDILLKVGHTAIVVNGSEAGKQKKILKVAKSFERGRAGTYKTTCTCNMRYGASTFDLIRKVLPVGKRCYNYGYFTEDSRGVKWLLCVVDGDVGYISERCLTV